ncbi:MAG: hypothetical protein M3R00_03560, partial [Pseudomonadota bacterium]|nr:hypothetical protein [Pseudomonadota bacterium]
LERCSVAVVKHLSKALNRYVDLTNATRDSVGIAKLEKELNILAALLPDSEAYRKGQHYITNYDIYYFERLLNQAKLGNAEVYTELLVLSHRGIEVQLLFGDHYESEARKVLEKLPTKSYLDFFSAGAAEVTQFAEKAFEQFERARINGSAEASYRIGLLLESGLIKKPHHNAIDYFNQAATKKYLPAQQKLHLLAAAENQNQIMSAASAKLTC